MKRLALLATLVLFWAFASAEAQTINTIAGGGDVDGIAATDLGLGYVYGTAFDDQGNAYVASSALHVVFRIAADGRAYRFAGTVGVNGNTGDGGPALSARLNQPQGVAVGPGGYVYVSDTGNNRVRVIDPSGKISTIAGTGSYSFGGDNGPATTASLSSPQGLAVDASGNLFIADYGNYRVRRVSGGIITTVAGNGVANHAGDGGAATSASLQAPIGLALDAAGSLLIADQSAVRKVTTSGQITSIVGNGGNGYGGDGGLATAAFVFNARGVAADTAGNVYVADTNNYRLRRIDAAGYISTVAGTGRCCVTLVDGTPSTSAQIYPLSVAVDAAGKVYFGDAQYLRYVDQGVVRTAAGNGSTVSFGGDDGPASKSMLAYPTAVVVDAGGRVLIADNGNHRVRAIAVDGTITTIAGKGTVGASGDGGAALSASLEDIQGLAADQAGNVYVSTGQRVRRIATNGIITTVAGTGACGYGGDGGLAISSPVCNPAGLAVDAAGNLYIADRTNHRIRKVDAGTGIITTVAGTGGAANATSGVPATSTSVPSPRGLAFDSAGSLYITSQYSYTTQTCISWFISTCMSWRYQTYTYNYVQRVTAGYIYSLVNGTTDGYYGDGGPSYSAGLGNPAGIAVDAGGNIYVADSAFARIRRISGGYITTFAGTGDYGFSGDGGPALLARMTPANGVAVDSKGAVYFADVNNNRVRRIASDAPPLANAGSDAVVEATNLTTAVTLDASASTDPDPADTLTFVWRNSAGAVVSTSATAVVQLGLGTSTFQVVVTDNHGAASIDSVSITVRDTTAPSITISSPQPGATYRVGQVVPALYTCSDAVSGVQSCVGTVAAGQPLDTSTAGPKSFAVAATDTKGNQSEVRTAYTVDRAVPTVTWSMPGAIVYGTPLSETQLNASASVGGTFAYDPPLGTVLGAGNSQLLSVTFTPSDSVNYSGASKTVVIDVLKATPTVTIGGGPFVYDGNAHAATVTVEGIGGVTLGPAAVTYDGIAGAPVDAGSYAVAASYAGDDNYLAVSATGSITIDRAPASLGLGGLSVVYDGSPKAVVVSTWPEGIAGVSVSYNGGSTVPTDAGSYGVVASLNNPNYDATAVKGTLVIAKAAAAISLGGLTATFDGNPKVATATTTPGGLAGVAVTYNGTPTAPINAGTYSVTATLDNPNYDAPPATGSLNINRADQSITFGSLPDRVLGDAPFGLSANATSGLPVMFAATGSCSVAGTTVSLTGGGACTITASQPGDLNHNPAPGVTQSFAVTYTWSNLLQPINTTGTSVFKQGSTVPVKFQLTGAGAGITNLAARIYVAQVSNGIVGTELEASSTAAADSGNTFRYDNTSGQYIFNLGTKAMIQGTWQIRVDLLDNAAPRTVLISVKK